MKKLISIEEANKKVAEKSGFKKNGIKCPQCEQEMFDESVNQYAYVSSYGLPQKILIFCACGFEGRRFA